MEGETLDRARTMAKRIAITLFEAGFEAEINTDRCGAIAIWANGQLRAKIATCGKLDKGKLYVMIYQYGRGRMYPERKDGKFHPELIERIVQAAKKYQSSKGAYREE